MVTSSQPNISFLGLSGEMNFPWTKFDSCLISMHCQLVNWPKAIPIPLQHKEHACLKAGPTTFGFKLLDSMEHLNLLVRALAYGQEVEDSEGGMSIIPNSQLTLQLWKNCNSSLSSLYLSISLLPYLDDQKDIYSEDVGNSAAVIYLDVTIAIKFKNCTAWLSDKEKAESKPATRG